MAVVQSPWRPWTPTDSHAKKDQAHMRGGPATKRTKLKEQAQPQRGPSSRSMQMVTTQGLERQEPKEPSPVKGKEQCIGNRQVGPEEEEQCRRSRHSSRRTGVVLEGPPCTVLDEEGTLWRERAGAVSLATL
ncbi:uncharacterized protein UDID_17689 [Ustilago sp. UG-2017a]|nr:uncharacterized protein UDID_17689 [Ustilago sp. UG-2017a]